MIVTVTLNPALDETWTVSKLTPGESHRVPTGASRAGGKGVNVARVLHATGHEVLAVAAVGGVTGTHFQSELALSGIPNRVFPVRGETRRSIAIVDQSDGSATLFNELGAALSDSDMDSIDRAVLALPVPAVFAVCGSLPPGYSAERLGRLVTGMRRRGARVIVDTSGPGLIAAATAGADLVKPNREELREATGADDFDEGIDALLRAGAGGVVASDGAAGLTVAWGGERWRARLQHAIADGNPTGAGDAAVASLAGHLADSTGAPGAEVLARRAVAWSSSAVTMPLAGEIDLNNPLHDEVVASAVTPTSA